MRPNLDKAVDRLLARVERGERQGLQAEFEALLEKNPDYHMTNYAMGVYRAMVQQDPVGAIPLCLDKALALDPSYEPALNNRQVIKRMTEGEPFIPEIFAETDYYRDRAEAEAEEPSKKRWWRKLMPWKAEAPG